MQDAMGYRLLPFCTPSSSVTSCIGNLSNAADESDNMLFSLVYEKKPLYVKADYKYINYFQSLLNYNNGIIIESKHYQPLKSSIEL